MSHLINNPLIGCVLEGPTGFIGKWNLLEAPTQGEFQDINARPGVSYFGGNSARGLKEGYQVSRSLLDQGLYPGDLQDYSPEIQCATPFGGKILHQHQARAVTYARLVSDDREGAIIGGDPGTGKTLIALHALWLDGLLGLPGVVIGPKASAAAWCDYDSDPQLSYALTIKQLEGRKKVESAALLGCTAFFLNYEILPAWGSTIFSFLKPSWVIFDELHYLMHPKSQRSEASYGFSMCSSISKRYGLTGSPLTNRRIDLWSMLRTVQPRQWGTHCHDFGIHFCAGQRHTYEGGGHFDYSGESNSGEMHDVLNCSLIRFTVADAKGLIPDQNTRVIELAYDAHMMREYEMCVADVRTFLERHGKIVPADSIVWGGKEIKLSRKDSTPKGLRLRAVNELIGMLSAAKAVGSIDHISELGSRHKHIVVFSERRATASLIAAQMTKLASSKLGFGGEEPEIFGPVDGQMPERRRRAIARAFEKSPRGIFVSTMRAVGISMNQLAVASAAVLVDLTWDPSVLVQSIARVRRANSKHPTVEILVFLLRGTVDDLILDHLVRKGDTIASAMPNDLASLSLASELVPAFAAHALTAPQTANAMLDSLCDLLNKLADEDEE